MLEFCEKKNTAPPGKKKTASQPNREAEEQDPEFQKIVLVAPYYMPQL